MTEEEDHPRRHLLPPILKVTEMVGAGIAGVGALGEEVGQVDQVEEVLGAEGIPAAMQGVAAGALVVRVTPVTPRAKPVGIAG